MAEGSVPDDLDEIIEQLGIYVPEDVDRESPTYSIFEAALNGHCMTCGAELGETTFAVIGRPTGLDKTVCIMVFCGGACLTDMQVLGWIQQTHDDIRQQIEFRGGHGGN